MAEVVFSEPRRQVTVTRDEHGVLHVKATRLEDAYFGLGYAHGFDRGLQLVMLRALGQGRGSELLDATLIGYASCFLKRYHPAAFLGALLNSQPMGFYGASTLVADGQRHGVVVKAPCVAQSAWDSTLEAGDEGLERRWWASSRHEERFHTPRADWETCGDSHGLRIQPALRFGLREVSGLSEKIGRRIVEAFKGRSPPKSPAEVVHAAQLPRDVAARLASAGAFSCFGLSRREALWRVMGVDHGSPLFAGVELPGSDAELPAMSAVEEMRADFQTTGLTTGLHPMALVRERMNQLGILG